MEPEIGVSDLHALYIQSLSTLSRITELFANAEAGKHAIKHSFSELFARDLPQGPNRLA